MRLPFLGPVVPPHVFCLLEEGVTYARIRREPVPGFEEARHFRYPGQSLGKGAAGAPLVTREAIAEAVKAARALCPAAASRGLPCCTRMRGLGSWPSSSRRPSPPTTPAGRCSSGSSRSCSRTRPESSRSCIGRCRRSTARIGCSWPPRPARRSTAIEASFEALGVRVGYLAPASLALFEGLAPTLAATAAGDYALLHRSAAGLSFLIGRGDTPLFFRQRPSEEDEEHDREARLSLSYYAERLKGPGLSAVFVHDERPEGGLESLGSFPVSPVRVTGRLFSADPSFDERLAARPELLAGFAAVYGQR